MDNFDVETAIETRLANKTPAEIDRERRYQEEQRQRVSVMDTRSEHAYRAIEIALANLAKNPDDDFEYTRLAEGYYLLGDFEKAAATTRNAEKKAEYIAYANAKPIQCGCRTSTSSGFVSPGKVGTVRISPRFVKEQFPGKNLIYCTNCHQYFIEQC